MSVLLDEAANYTGQRVKCQLNLNVVLMFYVALSQLLCHFEVNLVSFLALMLYH